MIVFACDVGGTHARLALVELEGKPRVVAREVVRVVDWPGLLEPLRAFLAAHRAAPRLGCVALAGTVRDPRRVQGLNLPWAVDAEELEAQCGFERVLLINDFEAAARGIDALGPEDLLLLQGQPNPERPRAVLGAGTGLGQAFLLPSPAGTRVVPTEGGHRGFAPTTPLQDRLLAHQRAIHGRVSTERVLSGPGLAAIYDFLLSEGRPACPTIGDATDRPAAVAASGHATCQEALGVFLEIYGAEAGNVALTVLADGGVFLAGGIAPKLLADPARQELLRGWFVRQGRFRDYLEGIPLAVVTEPNLGLLGAALAVHPRA
ncbi:MAG: glucokinase [Planctomycetes bacterium]|nr:glucokinase [Planctomycetota bacterium]